MATLSADASHATFAVEGTEFLVTGFEVREQISRPFVVSLAMASESETAFADIIGKSCLLTLESNDGDRYFHGIVADFSQVGMAGRFCLYKAKAVPAMALLALKKDVRIFQNKAVDTIISQVMNDAGISADMFNFRLQGTYPEHEYCVQYRESDLDFISRLLEAEGIFYFFEHSTDRHVVVFGDGTVNYQPISAEAQVVFNDGGKMAAEEETVTAFERTRRLHTGKYSLQDYLFKNPALNLSATAKDKQYDQYEFYDYPGEYATAETGGNLAKVRLQQVLLDGDVARGEGNVARFVPGFTFKLSGHDISSLNQEYLLNEIVHKGEQPQVLGERTQTGQGSTYGNSFLAIPATVTIRPKQTTPVPVVYGVHTAIVTGPAGEEIYTDEHGRVKIQFHWDRLGKRDEQSSCWIRVSQAWAGAGWGAMHIPRIGQEVIVSFIEGNPDRPIITGSVYHGTNTPPYALPGEKTKSTIKSDSTIGGGGSNEFRFEDKKGSEEIYLHGQKDWTIAIENDKNQTVGHDETLSVGNNRTKSVGVDQSETIGSNKMIKVGKNHTEMIGSAMNITVGSTLNETVGVNYAQTVGATMELTVGAALAITVGAAMTETVGGVKAESIGASKSENIGANKTLNVAKNFSGNVGSTLSMEIGKDINEKVAGKHQEEVKKEYMLQAKKIQLIAKDEINFKTGKAEIILKKNGNITIKGKKITVKGSSDVVIKGSKIKEN